MSSDDDHKKNKDNSNDSVSSSVAANKKNETTAHSEEPGSATAAPSNFTAPASPPRYVTMDQLTQAANAFYNMSLAHEITVDSNFRLEKPDPLPNSLEHTVKETMHRAFWDHLRASLQEDPPNYAPALRLLAEVKESLKGLVLPSQTSLLNVIESTLNMEEVETTLSATSKLNMEDYADRVIRLMQRFCAPVRDKEVANLLDIKDPVEGFRQLFAVLEKMHMDLANFTISQMRPYIRQQAVTYEREKFAAFLTAQRNAGIDGLVYTRQWIGESYDSLHKNASSSASMPSSSSAANEHIALTPNNILREAFLTLLSWPVDKDFPETVVMDQVRISELRDQLSRVVCLTSLILVVCGCVVHYRNELFDPRLKKCTTPDDMQKLKRTLGREIKSLIASTPHSELPNLSDNVVEQVNQIVISWRDTFYSSPGDPAETLTPPPPISDLIKRQLSIQVSQVMQSRHPVYILSYSRAINFFRAALSSLPPESIPLPTGFNILNEINSTSEDRAASPVNLPLTMTSGGIRRIPSRPDYSFEAQSEVKQSDSVSDLGLTGIAARFLPLLAHHRHVFGPYYAEIIQFLLSSSSNRVANQSTPSTS